MSAATMRASDFIESIGVNAHIDQAGSTYAKSDVIGQMRYLGIDNMRVLAPYDQAGTLSTYTSLGQQGIKFDVVPFVNHGAAINLASDMSMIDSIAPYVRTVEGPNEINTDPLANYNGQSGVNAAIALQKDLYAAVHSDARLNGVGVLGFSLSVGGSVTGFGDISQYADYGNVHGYAGQGVPPYYMLDYARTSVTTVTGKPVMMTETGNYTDFDGNSGVTQDVQAKWIMDSLLENAAKGVVKTYVYQLEDNGFDTGAPYSENHYGMFTNDGTAKQSAVDVHNLTSILADTGSNSATFATTALNYTVSGVNTDNTFNTSFAKSNGSTDIALWYEPQFYNAATGQASGVAAQNATVALGGTYNVKVFDPVAGTTAIATYQNVSSVNVALGTDPLIIEVSPVGGTTPIITNPGTVTSVTGGVTSLPPVTNPVTTTASGAVTLGSGSSSIVVGVSEDAYGGDAQFTVSVDGAQVGGTQTATASHAAGQSQAFTLKGSWAAGAHTVVVSFLNDLYGGGGTADRNLYVDGVTAGTTTVPGAPLYGNGSQSFTATLPPPPVVVSPVAAPVTLGSGSSSIVVGVSEDAFQGDAQFTVSVDGAQVGSTQTATASHAAGQSQAFTLKGNWAAGAHTVVVSFLNDLYGGGGTADRNLYVDGVTAGTTTVPGAPLYGNGSQSFTATLPTPPVVVPAAAPVTLGSGSSSIVVGVSEDAYQGDAQFTVSVDGAQIGGTQTATASHAAGQSQAFTLKGNWAAGAHTVAVSFLNDLYGGSAATDRNLYVDTVAAGGTTTTPNAALLSNGSQSFAATLTSSVTTIGSGAGSIVVGLSEDAYQGDAQFTIAVDGVQIGGTQTATASHAAGKSQMFNVLGAFGAGPHSVSVSFLNDAWGGTAATDRNLYVDNFTAGGVTKAVGLSLMAPGSQSFTTPAVIGPATLASNPTLAFVTAAKAVTIDGGATAGKTLTGGTVRDVFVLHAGTSNGDTITNFKPSLTAGDFLELKGYGTGATLTQVDSTTWTANSASGAIHDVIKLTNAAALVPANVLFA